ncbi:MAG: hypothetical protein AMQ74_01749 [Candidatus Methanofastidiosum methylothiophilum]|uniref:Uncharacterized protein n=1 Tax=Candidatus Methanofastidiosum methylothiophilum TaxID=1705564 RepID=A0A150IP33_9EURY|nr:MAG: hypothetical protein AMQ74_01749 [Candidatus Methanofastidiosum methylthiophilus]
MGLIMEAISDLGKIAFSLLVIGFIIGLVFGVYAANANSNTYTSTQTTSNQPVQQPTVAMCGCDMTEREAQALRDYNKYLADDNRRLYDLLALKEGTILNQKFEIDALNAEIGRLKFEISVMKELNQNTNK